MTTSSLSIRVDGIFKQLGRNQALRGVSTFFDSGLMHGVIGPEGAGKTTLFRHLVGLLKADQGQIQYSDQGQSLRLEAIRERIAYMPQQQSLYPDLSIDEHLLFFKEMYHLTSTEFSQKREKLLEITSLGGVSDRSAGQLSGGMYKKLGLMCALMSSPEVLLLDEPTNGVDPVSRREFWNLLYALREERILIIVATAYMDEAERCSKVHLLNEGRLIGSGEPSVLLKQCRVRSFDEYFLKHLESTDEGV